MANFAKNLFVIAITVATVATFGLGFVAPEVAKAADAGSLVKGPNSDAVYYIGDNMTKYVFPDAKTYFSWYSDFSGVELLTVAELDTYADGGSVLYRAGTKMITHPNTAKVYVVETNGAIRWIASEEVAAGLYGADWASRVNDISEVFFPFYSAGADLTSATDVPNGSLVMMDGSDTIYLIDGTTKRPFASMDVLTANGYDADYVLTVSDLSAFSDGTSIGAAESSLMDVSQGGTISNPIVPAGSGLTVALAASNPAATSIIADSSSGTAGAQGMVPMLAVNFTAAADGNVTVDTVKFKRSGIPSADADFSAFYLYDGSTLVAQYTSISSGVLTFTDSAGLFTVNAGTTKTLTLKMDVAEDLAASRVSKWSLLDASYVEAGATAVSGVFPIDGNSMSSAQVSDLGNITIANSAPSSTATVNAGELNHEMWKFSLVAEGQDMEISYLKFTNIGTISNTDIRNITLKNANGTQYGETLANFAADGTLTFDLSASPITVVKGNTDYYSVRGDIIAGTNRTFRLSMQQMYHMVAKDTEYGVYTKVNLADSWTIIQAGGATTINTGTMTVSRDVDSPSGNVPLSGTSVEVARINYAAVGENVKVTTLPIMVTRTAGSSVGLYAVKAYVDGSQIGSTTNLTADRADEATDAAAQVNFSLGNNFIVPAGETKTVIIKADIKEGDGTVFTADDSFTVTVNAGTCTGVVSLTSVTCTAQAGNLLTVTANTLTAAKNAAVAEWTSSNPVGVSGSAEVMVGSFVMTAGSSEGVNMTSFVITDETAFGNYQNLRLKKADGTQIGTTQASLTAGTSYTFTPSSPIYLAASDGMVFNLYADIKSSTTNDDTDNLVVDAVNGTGAVTNTSANYTGDLTLQTLSIASSASTTTTIDGATPASMQLVTGSSDNHIATFRVEETTGAENVTLTKIIVKNSTAADTTLINWALYDGETGAQIGSTVPVSSSGVVTFNALSWFIPAGEVKTFKVKVGVSGYTAATENTANYAYLASGNSNAFEGNGSGSGTMTITVGTSNISANSMKVFRTVMTATGKTTANLGGAYGATQEIAKFGLVADANYNAKFQAAVVNAVADNTNWVTDIGAAAVIDEATYTIDGAAIELNENSGATADDSAFYAGASAAQLSVDYSGYKYAGFWIMSDIAEAASDVEFCLITGATSTVDSAECSAAAAGTVAGGSTLGKLPALTADIWDYVEVDISGVTRTDVDGYGINFVTGLVSGQQVYLDSFKFYNDSINLDISGNLGTATTSDGLVVYMKDASGTTVMTGYLDNANSTSSATVMFVPGTSAISIGSTEQVYTVTTNTTTLMATDDTSDQSLNVNIDLGGVSTAGDFRWYDGAITATSPITWVSGPSDPITFSFSY